MAQQQQQDESSSNSDGRYTVDIRVFIGLIVTAMALSFGVGVGMGPSATELFQARLEEQQQQHSPKVTSVNLDTPHEIPSQGGTEVHEPAGQHLLVDIKGIEADFLDSESRLANAMVETVQQSGLTMLSYHCHKLIPKGVSCVGVLLESHISFHTWPDEGVITLDLFTCGNKPLIPAVGTIKELFGIPRANDEIRMQWSHELRGFRNKNKEREQGAISSNETTNYAVLDHNSDLSQMVWSPIDCVVKDQIVSTLTKYQRVDIWDLVGLEETPSYEDALRHNLQPGDPRWTTAEIVSPTRHLFLDGVLQSEQSSHIEYHEAMVHPGMFSHPSPTNVAIVGGGEGATLREVLKHKTVDKVTMIEIDEELIGLVKTHMPYFSNCTDMVGRADDCFQDDATNLVIQDANTWFQQQKPTSQFDVIILDAMEPEMGTPISRALYETTDGSLDLMVDSLTEEGILVIQIGGAPTILDPRPDIGFNAPRERLFQALEGLDQVAAMFVYEDPHCGFQEPKAFLVVCKSNSCRSRFYATADEMDYYIYDRIVRTQSKTRALKYFDGVTHLGYQVAPKAWETIYCRREPTPFECAYRHLDFKAPLMEFNLEDEAAGAFSVTADYETNDDGSEGKTIEETHVWANVDIPKGAYIMAEHLASSLQLSHQSIANLKRNLEYGGVTVIEDFVNFVEEHGHESQATGSERSLVEIGASYFIQPVDTEEEANVGRWMPPHPNGKRPTYSPVYERHRLSFDVFMVATKDIPKGAELKRYSKMWETP